MKHLGKTRCLQCIDTLFGSAFIGEGRSPTLKKCYYFYKSLFFRYNDSLDGAIVSYSEQDMIPGVSVVDDAHVMLQLCVNTLSPRYELFAKSKLATTLQSNVIDPNDLEKKNEAYVVKNNIARSDQQIILDYLSKTYNLVNPYVMPIKHNTITLRF